MAVSKEQAARLMKKAGQSPAEIAKQLGGTPGGAPNKYHAKRTSSDIIGRTFHSDAERRYAEVLYAREQAGEIAGLRYQVSVKLLGAVTMRPDFYYVEDGEKVWDEFKGFTTDSWRLQRKLWEVAGPGHYRVTRERKGRYVHDDIYPAPNDAMIVAVLKHLLSEAEGGE